MATKIVGRSVAGIVTVLLGIWFNYLMLPAWNMRSPGMWAFLLCIAVIAIVSFAISESIANSQAECSYFGTGIIAILIAIIVIVLVIGGVTSSHMFNASQYHNMVTIEEANFSEDIPKVEEDDIAISIVDVATAKKLGDRTIGGIKNATWYEVDNEYNLIQYQGKYYRISALNYGGLFKYGKAKYDGIPGYVLVNVENQEAKYIALDEPIRYSPSAHYSYNLSRHLRKLYPSYMFGISFFEIDEDGNPYYITAVKRPSIGMFGGKKEETFIITKANTGECQEYKNEELPAWVEHAYDLKYLMEITKNNQSYINGWWNSWTSHTGVNTTTYEFYDSDFAGYNTAITSKGEVVFYTGVTPVSTSESNLGFILANPRTGEIKYYKCDGAEESSAQNAAQGLVQNLGYEATFPTILNVDGAETYFMLLKDNAGLVQRYALCNVKDYTKVVQSETFEETLNLYRNKIGTEQVVNHNEEETIKAEGTIKELYEAQIDGCTFYYFTIEGSDNLYMSSIKNNNKQVLLKEGAKVQIEYVNFEDGIFLVEKIQF